jgi:hypothetical protein
MITARKSSGNMTVLMSLVFGIVVAVCVIGLAVNSLFFQRTRDQHEADAVAVTLAGSLNAQNRLGQFNELECFSRELIYVDRTQFQTCLEREPIMAPLANQLLDEGRTDQRLLENERRNLGQVMAKDVREFVHQFNQQAQSRQTMLPWLSANNFQIQQVKLGKIKNVLSNIALSDAIPDLARFDAEQPFVDARSRLYKADVDVRLPVDSDLNFEFAAVPACIKGTCSPARNTNEDVFWQYARASAHCLPTAVQIICGSDVRVGGGETSGKLQLRSTAITAGASASDM